MIAATILPLVGANGDPAKAILLASALAILTGVIMIAAGAGRLGFVADLLSKPTILGYMNGLALTILVGQLPKLFGFSVDADGFIGEAIGVIQGIIDGEVVLASAAIGLVSLAIMIVLGRVLPKVPAVLVAVVVDIVLSIALSLAERGVAVVGPLDQGLPAFTIPTVGFSDLTLLLVGALGISLVALADTISTATSFAERQGVQVDGNREMIGIGTANVAAGLFQGFPVSTSGSRTAVAEKAGSRTQLTGLVGAAMIALMLIAFPDLLADLPQPTLAAVVIVASISLADLPATRRLYRQRRADFALSMAAFLGVVLLGVLPGIVLAIVLSVANVFRRIWWPYFTTLGHMEGIAGLHDVTGHPEAALLDGCTVVRFDAPLIFANAGTFREHVLSLASGDPKPAWIVVAAEPITDVDTTACDMLEELVGKLDQRGVRLVFAELKDPARRKIDRYGLEHVLGDDRFYPTIRTATDAYVEATGADWVRPTDSA
jgi:high affinity sulfate transporter 1